jgi:membrane protein YqaA with SNARE-associated domain
MFESFWIIFKNIFFAFTVIPFSSGTYYKTALIFFGNTMPFVAKILAITLALIINYFLGRLLRMIVHKKQFAPVPKKAIFFLLISFIPVISGFISFYCGLGKVDIKKFISIIFFVNTVYYAIALYFPILNIYF